ncbi:MAG: hypothetical protein ACM3X5_09810 [Bacillota bacterium]
MNRLLVALAGVAAGIGGCYYCGRKAKHLHREMKEHVHRWEDEGGNVPEVETPAPQVQPQSSFPAGAPQIH